MSKSPPQPKGSIDRYVLPYIASLADLDGKVAIDIPTGEGRASYFFAHGGARVRAFDLYPEFAQVDGVDAEYADMNDGIPVDDSYADFLVCQEGIEHMPDRVSLFREFNRVLKPRGRLIVTTPNLSNARGRLWMAITESDSGRRMPVSELDSLWFTDKETDRLYFGHLFLTTVQHLQTVSSITGFRVVERRRTEWSPSSILIGTVIYPFLALGTLMAYLAYRGKNPHIDEATRKQILWERLKLNLSPQTIFGKHIFWVLEKDKAVSERIAELKGLTKSS